MLPLRNAASLCIWSFILQPYWIHLLVLKVKVKVAQLCPTLSDPMNYIQSIEFTRPETGVGSCSPLQGIFPIQGSNPGLPHCRWILYQLRPLGKPKNTVVDSLSLLQQIFPTQESNQGLLNCRRILYHLIYQETQSESVSPSVVSNSLWPHEL